MITLVVLICAAFGWVSWLTVAFLLPALYFAETGLLWVLYLAVMNLQRVRDDGRLPSGSVPLAEIVLYIGLVQDLIYNWSWACVVYFDVPLEPLVTGRLIRYKFGTDTRAPATGWRLARTEWYADIMLDPFDPDPRGHVRR